MAVKFKDYYETLGVPRGATPEEVQRAYRQKARKLHPDVNKAADAEARFKEVTEAYEVLGDPDKRQRYDQLGANWRGGEEFTPPPGWENVQFDFDLGGSDGLGGFSDFFSMLFGEAGGGFAGRSSRGRRTAARHRGVDQEVELPLALEEVAAASTKAVQLEGPDGRKHYDVKLPTGLIEGSRIRLSGQGGRGAGGAPDGDLYLIVRLLPHPRFEVHDHDLRTAVVVTPWEAALGAEVLLLTLTGSVALRVPAGSSSGQTLRLRGQGLPRSAGERGDLLAVVRIAVPATLSPRERELFEQLGRASEFRPEERSRKP